MIIGFTGPAGSGKTTACEFFNRRYGALIYNFADPIKNGIASLFGFNLAQCFDPALKEVEDPILGFSPRRAMQVIGTEGVRNHLGQDTWVKIMEKRTSEPLIKNGLVVIGDVRFNNEAIWIRKNLSGGCLVHLIGRKTEVSPHSSEEGVILAEGDIIIENSETLLEFRQKLFNLAGHLKLHS